MSDFSEIRELNQEIKDLMVQQQELTHAQEEYKIQPEMMAQHVRDYVNGLIEDVKDVAVNVRDIVRDVLGLDSSSEKVSESGESVTDSDDRAREYGLEDCANAAKEIFTEDVITSWGMLDITTRQEIVEQYAKAIAEGLGIDYKGITWERLDEYTYGYNSGNGYLHLNESFLHDPGMLMLLVDTIAHEARHQFQCEVIANPDKYNGTIDDATINEWTVAQAAYTVELPSSYDPWGYTYNPLEIDSRYFGESMVRELTRNLINNA